MTAIPSLATRTALNIDSLERAIVYAATLLKACYLNSNPQVKTDRRIQITHREDTTSTAQIIIRAEVSFNMVLALTNGGRILDSLINNDEVVLLRSDFVSFPSNPNFPEIPIISSSNIDTLEKYFYLCCSLLKASLEITNKAVEISFLEDDRTGGKAQVNIVFPFDFQEWLKNNNYVNTVQRITESYVDVGDTFKATENQAFTFNNQSQLNNSSLIGN